MKGIVLAGGSGTRLYPLTQVMSKQLLPIYDKPMIYYPLSTLILGGIDDILIITTAQDLPQFRALLGDGAQWGVRLSYAVQPTPDGLAQAFIIGATFIGDCACALILGDNLFYGDQVASGLQRAKQRHHGATVFGYRVRDPQRYGVVAFNDNGQPSAIVEKPAAPPSDVAVTGLYVYDNDVVELARSLVPSARGELEITDLNSRYLERGDLHIEMLGRGTAWLDTGTHLSLLKAAQFIEVVEERQALKVGCVEESAWRMGFISDEQLVALAEPLRTSGYGEYLLRLTDGQREL